jgi:hypothetical protein
MRTKTALVEFLKESQDYRKLFKGCSKASAFRLRSQAYRFRDELRARDYDAPLDEVQDALFELARDLLPASPGADFVTWVGFLCGDAFIDAAEEYNAHEKAQSLFSAPHRLRPLEHYLA